VDNVHITVTGVCSLRIAKAITHGADDCDVTHVKRRFEESDRQTSQVQGTFSLVDASSTGPLLPRFFPRVTFSKAIEFTSVSSFLLSPVIGQSQSEDAGDLWLLRSNVRIDPVIPLRKSRRKRKILSKRIIRQSTWRLYLL